MADFDLDIMYEHRVLPSSINGIYTTFDYYGKYYNSDDRLFVSNNGQHLRYTYNDEFDCPVIEIFSCPKEVQYRYNDHFQKSYGKIIISQRNILKQFNIKVDKYKKALNPVAPDINSPLANYSINLSLHDLNVLYSENSEDKLQSMVLGSALHKVLVDMLDVIDSINKEVGIHIHPNVSTAINYRTSVITKKIDTIKAGLTTILSTQGYLN